MAFKDLTNDELGKVAEFFGVDVISANPVPTKKEFLTALAAGDEPVLWSDYEDNYLPTVAPAPVVPPVEEDDTQEFEVVPEELDTVLKMERPNGRFDIRGYTFTKEHPYRPVTTADADWIVTNEEGFRRATTQEVADYYS